jgi:shikimate dehydrogenase
MHNNAFKHIGYNGVYLAFNVKNIKQAIEGMKSLGIKGFSVTIPHKQTVMEHLDEIDEKAQNIGAVNTIINTDGRLIGYNSDCLGAMSALKEKTNIKDKNVIIIGAGGAARAIGFGIRAEGGKLTILNKFEDEGELLAKDLDVNYYPIEEFENKECDILIHATPLGMTPDVHTTPVKKEALHKNMVVMDIVYNPLKTRLLKEAEDIGCTIVDGVSMFIYQAVFQFELWTGKKAPVNLMRKVVLDALNGK